ncbi:uncharacterized protein LOC119082775 [Bradysia coprophila]|uniref:uncharacterized protein LOC119082775 n=1 Tax=Bradysia coprophila TaxID=38358 RepID=UPI00187D70A7|nr:uncharacterized protein LOC119082775 [Bradysia coprophila]
MGNFFGRTNQVQRHEMDVEIVDESSIQRYRDRIGHLDVEIKQLKYESSIKDQQIKALNDRIIQYETTIRQLEHERNEDRAVIAELRQQIDRLVVNNFNIRSEIPQVAPTSDDNDQCRESKLKCDVVVSFFV